MRLLQLCSVFGRGGITRHVLDLTTWLRSQGHHVTMAGTPAAWFDSSMDDEFYELPLNQVTSDGGGKLDRMFQALRCALIVRRLLKENKIQLIHAHESAPAVVARLASLGLGIPVAVTFHGSEPERVPYFGKVGRYAADWVITPSHNCAADLHERGGIPKEKLRVIGLGIKEEALAEAGDVQCLRKTLLGEEGKRLVLTIARLSHQKGIDILVHVVQRILHQRRDIRFAVVGDGPQERDARKWAEAAGVDAHLQFLGASDQPHLHLAAADLFLLTSRWEALPLTIVEAFRQALPVVATDCGGVSEMVDDTVGRVVPIGEVETIVGAVLELMADDGRRTQMSANARTRSLEDRFSPEVVHEAFERAYTEMLGSS